MAMGLLVNIHSKEVLDRVADSRDFNEKLILSFLRYLESLSDDEENPIHEIESEGYHYVVCFIDKKVLVLEHPVKNLENMEDISAQFLAKQLTDHAHIMLQFVSENLEDIS